MKSLLRPAVFLACAMTVTTILAGCQATVDARWATTDDTVDHWEKAVPNLPIEVRGQLQNASIEQIARAIPNAVPAQSLASNGSNNAVDDPAPRLIVEVGSDSSPHDNAYCAKPGKDQMNAATGAPLALTVTLCDGPRLVASSRSPLDPNKASVVDIPRQIDRLKNLILIGIARSAAQDPDIQG